jgi:hypothetical protein
MLLVFCKNAWWNDFLLPLTPTLSPPSGGEREMRDFS